MELILKIDGEDGLDFEELLGDSLRKAIIKDCKSGLASDKFQEFSRLVSDSITADIKLRMENFLSEEIALTEKWGKPTFVGSVEDLIKKRFDDILLRPVNNDGKTLQGCTADGNTWIEWRIKDSLEDRIGCIVKAAAVNIEKSVSGEVKKKIIEMKDDAIKRQVDSAFTSILKQE